MGYFQAVLHSIPFCRRFERLFTAFDRREPIQNRRSLTVDVIDRLQAMVVCKNGVLVAVDAFGQYCSRCIRLVEKTLRKKMDVPFQDLQFAR